MFFNQSKIENKKDTKYTYCEWLYILLIQFFY